VCTPAVLVPIMALRNLPVVEQWWLALILYRKERLPFEIGCLQSIFEDLCAAMGVNPPLFLIVTKGKKVLYNSKPRNCLRQPLLVS
jgi:hypothetical protein